MKHIMEEAVAKFLDPTIPKWGPHEEETGRPVRLAEGDPTGEGLGRHDMLYIGEGDNTMYLIVGGKTVWTYSTGKGWEYDDIWMLTNGNILFSRMYWAAEITPHKEQVWRYDAPEGTEIHTLQPLGLDKLAMVINEQKGPRLLIINKKTGETEVDKEIPYGSPNGTHGQNRRFRVTADGTYLMPYLSYGDVVEYDTEFNEIRRFKAKKPWAAIRLKNGNTLISDESDESVLEYDLEGNLVWHFSVSELPEDIRIAGTQSCVRLENGNTILCARGEGGKTPQLVEITPDKKVVWVLKDWEHLGPGTAIQVLYDGGIPENPGECQR